MEALQTALMEMTRVVANERICDAFHHNVSADADRDLHVDDMAIWLREKLASRETESLLDVGRWGLLERIWNGDMQAIASIQQLRRSLERVPRPHSESADVPTSTRTKSAAYSMHTEMNVNAHRM